MEMSRCFLREKNLTNKSQTEATNTVVFLLPNKLPTRAIEGKTMFKAGYDVKLGHDRKEPNSEASGKTPRPKNN